MGAAVSERKPWFLVMTPADANRPDSPRIRYGAVSRGKVVATPIAPEGWLVLLAFVALVVGTVLLIWGRGVTGGSLSIAAGVVATLIAIGVLVGGLVWVIRAGATRLPPAQT